jgi:hypothetical protein
VTRSAQRRSLVAFGVVLAGCRPAAGTERPSTNEPASTSASIDKGLIRTVVRTHVHEIRGCYELGLADDPALAGRVAVRFTIDPHGMVSEAVVASSNLPPRAEPVQTCIAAAVKGWRFPMPPASGSAVVLYPFVLEPGRKVTSPSGLIEGEQVDGRWFEVDGLPADAAVVEVLDLQHRPVAAMKVVLALAIGAASEEREATTDELGRAVFEGLPNGATAIAMVAPDVRTESTVVGSGAIGVIMIFEVAAPSPEE